MMMRVILALLGCLVWTGQADALTAQLTRDGVGRVVQASVETDCYALTVDGARGARVVSLVDKALGADIVRFDEGGLGGLFEDRPLFSGLQYLGDVVVQAEDRLVLRFSVKHSSGIGLRKTYEFTEGRPTVKLVYEIENPTQLPLTLWIRNFANPGGDDLTPADRIYLRQEGKLQELSGPTDYYGNLTAPWMAYVDAERKSGFFVRCDFGLLDKFYFWSASRVTPTWEWIYQPVPAGHRARTGLIFGLISGLSKVAHITEEGAPSADEPAADEQRVAAGPEPLPGWRPLEELYAPDKAERARGFLLVTSGLPAPAPRLSSVGVDLGLDEVDAVPLEVFGVADACTIRATIDGFSSDAVTLQYEEGGWLADGDAVLVTRGNSGRLWLKVRSSHLPAGTHEEAIRVSSGTGEPLDVPLRVTVWDVRLPDEPLIGTQWYAFVPTLSGSYELDDAARRRFIAFMDNMQQLRCDNLDWAVQQHLTVPHLRVVGTGETLTAWGQAHPEAALEDLPALDWSYYDLWFEEPVKRNMTRFVAHVPSTNGWRGSAVINAVFPGRQIEPESEQGWAVMVWYYRQLREYAAAKGFTSFWAKLDDEIPAEHIPTWLSAARRYRQAGYRPFTTNTGAICRSDRLLNEMNRESDAWQVALGLSRDFRDLTTKAAVYEAHREVVPGPWVPYTNGGAEKTWCVEEAFFAGERSYSRVDEIAIYADGKPLEFRDISPWGNQTDGVFFMYGPHIYLRLSDGGDPNESTIETSYRLRSLVPSSSPAVPLEPTDEIWYYGGGSYAQPYETARAYPWRAVAWNMRGYGYWTYLWWNDQDILVRYDAETGQLAISAAWEGLRDGNEDADYFLMAEKLLSTRGDATRLAELRSVFDERPEAELRLGEHRWEVYAWDDILNPTYIACNSAKRRALRVLAESAAQ